MRRLILALAFFAAVALAMPSHAESQSIPESRAQITLTYAPLVKQVAPAVVNIYAQKKIKQQITSPMFDDPFFRRFFQDMMPPGFSKERLEQSLGSGVLVSPKGLIVTSNHVITGADQIRVVLADRRELDASIVLADDRSDLAILRIEAKGENLPYLDLKDSDEAQVGDLVLAIGDPFGVGQTVTSGIISALTHTDVGTGNLNYFIQTDAAINPGNSGGALVTMDGKLVGINSAIYSRDGGNLGIGFAVPSNMVRTVLEGVAQGKKTLIHPWTGFEGQEVTADIASSLKIPPSGVLISKVRPGGPAATSGLRTGDVIVSINGRAIDDPESFNYRIATLPVGSSVMMGVVRKGEKLTVSMQLIAPPENPPRDAIKITGQNPLAGATIANLSPAVSEELNLHGDEHGVVVTKLEGESPAANVGLQEGDIVRTVNGAKIAQVDEAIDALMKPAHSWHIAIQRGDQLISVIVGG